MALTKVVAIGTEMTAGELHDKLMLAGAGLMKDAMERLDGGELPLTPQAEQGVLYAAKISKAETRIDFSKTATEVHNHIRGLSPFPGAWFELETGGKLERIKVLSSVVETAGGETGTALFDDLTIACGDGSVRLTRLQKAGGKVLNADDFRRGTPVPAGTRLS